MAALEQIVESEGDVPISFIAQYLRKVFYAFGYLFHIPSLC